MAAFDDPEILARHEWWQENVNGRLPALLQKVLCSDSYGMGDDRMQPSNEYGVYLFSPRSGTNMWIAPD